jgi:hypothetical protein
MISQVSESSVKVRRRIVLKSLKEGVSLYWQIAGLLNNRVLRLFTAFGIEVDVGGYSRTFWSFELKLVPFLSCLFI